MVFHKLEALIGENLPECVKKILLFCGFNTISSFKNISVDEIEKFMNSGDCGRKLIESFDCCYKKRYSEQTKFAFLPGHKSTVLALSDVAHEYTQQRKVAIPSYYPFILRELMDSAENNYNNLRPTYSETIKLFATFLYVTCGRSSYVFLSKNLPLPSVATVCKLIDLSLVSC